MQEGGEKKPKNPLRDTIASVLYILPHFSMYLYWDLYSLGLEGISDARSCKSNYFSEQGQETEASPSN